MVELDSVRNLRLFLDRLANCSCTCGVGFAADVQFLLIHCFPPLLAMLPVLVFPPAQDGLVKPIAYVDRRASADHNRLLLAGMVCLVVYLVGWHDTLLLNQQFTKIVFNSSTDTVLCWNLAAL